MVEYLVHNLKVEGLRPACAQILFPLHRRKISVALKTLQKIQAQMEKKVFASCTNLVFDIQSGYQKLTSRRVTVYC